MNDESNTVKDLRSDLGLKERELVQEIVDALHCIDIYALPTTSRGDTIRGLLWALEYLLSPEIQPSCAHQIPFNASITKDQAAVRQAAVNEVWQISSALLVGVHFLNTHGHVNSRGVELPASWSPGDFCCVVDDVGEALRRLEKLANQLYELKYGEQKLTP